MIRPLVIAAFLAGMPAHASASGPPGAATQTGKVFWKCSLDGRQCFDKEGRKVYEQKPSKPPEQPPKPIKVEAAVQDGVNDKLTKLDAEIATLKQDIGLLAKDRGRSAEETVLMKALEERAIAAESDFRLEAGKYDDLYAREKRWFAIVGIGGAIGGMVLLILTFVCYKSWVICQEDRRKRRGIRAA